MASQSPEARREAWVRYSRPSEGINPAKTLILDFCPLELWDDKFLFKPPSLGYLGMKALANGYRASEWRCSKVTVKLWWKAGGRSGSCRWPIRLRRILSCLLAYDRAGNVTRPPSAVSGRWKTLFKHLLPDEEVQCIWMNTQYIAGTQQIPLSFSPVNKLGPWKPLQAILDFWDLSEQAGTGSRCSSVTQADLVANRPLIFSYAMSLYEDAVIQHESSSF